jgi:tetratricopeptide (TPR) repeat protein
MDHIYRSQLALMAGICACTCLLLGCGTDESVDQRQQGSQAFVAGNEAFAQRKFTEAVEALTKAIESGALPVDSYCEAMVKRTIAYAQLGQFEQALADLDKLAQGTPDMASVHAARSFIFRKQGKAAEADREFALARRYNPDVKVVAEK